MEIKIFSGWLRAFFLILVSFYFFSSFAASESSFEKEIADLKAFIDSGISYIKNQGTAKAYKEFNNVKGKFRKDGLYMFVMDYNGTVLAHGDEPANYVGRKLFNAKDQFGTPYFQLFVEAANRGGGVVSYYWPYPGSGALKYKTSYIKPIDSKTFIGAGVYKAFSFSESQAIQVARVKQYLADAIKYFNKHGAEAAYQEFSKPKGLFTREDFYIFVVGYDGYTWAHGGDAKKWVGKNISELKDEFGTPMLLQFVEAARSGGGLATYYWPNYAKGGSILLKVSYIEPLNDKVFIGAGYYSD